MNPRVFFGSYKKATVLVAFFFGLAILCSTALAETWRVRVDTVLDGDTLIAVGGERIRLRGIDAPEIRHGSEAGQYYGQAARKLLWDQVRGQELLLDRDELDMDRYGRKVAVVRLSDGRMLNAVLVEAGAAFVYPHHSDKDEKFTELLLSKQRQAMSQQLGFWAKILTLSKAQDRYIGTKGSRRFHTLACANAASVRPANQVAFSSLAEAFRAGFAPARECTVWPHGE